MRRVVGVRHSSRHCIGGRDRREVTRRHVVQLAVLGGDSCLLQLSEVWVMLMATVVQMSIPASVGCPDLVRVVSVNMVYNNVSLCLLSILLLLNYYVVECDVN